MLTFDWFPVTLSTGRTVCLRESSPATLTLLVGADIFGLEEALSDKPAPEETYSDISDLPSETQARIWAARAKEKENLRHGGKTPEERAKAERDNVKRVVENFQRLAVHLVCGEIEIEKWKCSKCAGNVTVEDASFRHLIPIPDEVCDVAPVGTVIPLRLSWTDGDGALPVRELSDADLSIVWNAALGRRGKEVTSEAESLRNFLEVVRRVGAFLPDEVRPATAKRIDGRLRSLALGGV